jgi:hypothetical protein
MVQNEILHDPHHLRVHWERPKWFLSLWYVRHKPCTYLMSRLAPCHMNWIKHPLEHHHLGVLSGASKTISEPTVCLHKPCTYLELTPTLRPNGLKHDLTWPTSPRTTIGCVQNDFWACVTFGANRALSCVKISTISKWTESSIHLSLVT